MVNVEVFVEGDFIADDGFAVVDPSVRDVWQDFLVEIGFDPAFIGKRDILGVAEFAVRFVEGGAAVLDDRIPGAGGEALLLGVDFQIEFLGDDGRGLGIAPGDGVEDGLELGRAGLEFEFLEGGFDILGEEGEVVPVFLAELLVEFSGDFQQLAAGEPELGIEEFFQVRAGEFDLFVVEPALDGFLFPGEEVLLVNVLAPLGKDPLHFGGEGFVEAQRGDALGGELGGLPQRALDGDFPVTEFLVVEDLGFQAIDGLLAGIEQVEVGAGDLGEVVSGEGTVFRTEVLTELFEKLGGIDELDLALAALGFPIGEQPDVGGDAGVVEDVVRKLDDGFEQVVLDEVLADVAGPTAGISGEEGGTIVDGGDARACRGILEGLHLAHHFHEEEELAVVDGGRGAHQLDLAGCIGQFHLEAGIDDDGVRPVFLKDLALVGLPALAVGRIRQHEVEAGACELVGGESGAVADVLGVVALDHHVRLADGIGLGIDLLAVEVDGGLGADGALGIDDEILGLGEHAAGTAGGIVNGDDGRELLFHRLEQQVDHELDDLARGEVLSGLLVVLLVELADEFLKDVAHAEIGQAGELAPVRADGVVVGEIDVRGDEFFEDAVEGVRLRHFPDLVAEIELGDDFGDVGAEAVEVVIEVRFQLGGISEQTLEGELGGVVEDLAGCFAEAVGIEQSHACLDFLELHLGQHGFLGILQQAIDPAEHEHRENDIAVFSADEDIAEAVVRDGPDEGDDFIVGGVIHYLFCET